MTILALMIPMALVMGFGFLAAFFFALEYGQFDDLETPAHRILFDETNEKGK
ncbi:MAG: cbb3-type cytochrome oxidase assembly protein CcoS [Bdellovibrionales bacterium]|nr:cbb3-type cytochrome oxidase assembly protein CcoS [Bdellovibrionales bacterium]